ncbi:sensor histidine kinase [Levyella massiliensis]|uniref:sensor histidine kinase n=1 Tax=Levyella massiliensis TaxID=938289 RepID=UPI0003662FB8|nr:HAMP domain-containing sensor histidine kinase [Levyella massiliensis]
MTLYYLLTFIIILALLIIIFLISKLFRIRNQIDVIIVALNDIKAGNMNRRILSRDNDITRKICYGINEIAINNQTRLIQQKQSEQAYKRLMTSLSHDVKTPLASLVGYLDAVESGLVENDEKEEYIHIASGKAQHLRQFVESLFEWVKLDAGEQIFHFEEIDLNEISREIVADWIPTLEAHRFQYEIAIPEEEYIIHIDSNAYTRILNNLFQNAIAHSAGNHVIFTIIEDSNEVVIMIRDNGKGISPEHISHIFERMYQVDSSRTGTGNGLGLAITKELIRIHNGTIRASSKSGNGTTFTITLPRTL